MGSVGNIVICTDDKSRGKSLQKVVKDWLINTGWRDLVSVTWVAGAESNFVEFRPGKFQSNGPQKINLEADQPAFYFSGELRSWLNEITR